VLSVTSSLDSLSGIISPPISTAALGSLGSPWAAAYSCFFALIAFIAGVVQGRRDRVRIPHATPQKEGAS